MSKSKLFFIIISLGLIGMSIYIYVSQKDSRGARVSSASDVKAQLLDYDLYRYRNDEIVARVSGNKATLRDHGTLVCKDGIRAIRVKDGLREELEAKTATVKFKDDSVLSQKANTVETIELSGDVAFTKGAKHFQTEWVLYTEKTGDVYSDKPVRIDSEEQFVAAEGGMTYNARSEAIKLRGGVFGTLKTDDLQKGMGGKK